MGSTRKGMLNVLIAAVLWGSSGVCAQYIMEQSQMSSQFLTMTRLIFAGLILLTLSFVHGDKIFSIINNHKDAISLLIFSVVGALTVQLTFLLTIEKSNAATATVLQFLSPTIIVAWFSLVRKSRPGILVFCAILTSLVGTFLLVTHGNPTSLSISPAALFWGIASAFAAAFYTTYPSTLIARYGLMNPLMILVKIIKLRWIHILSYDQMVSRKINNQTTRCANSIFYTTLFTNSAPNYT